MYRVLIADDERVIRGGLSTLLKGEGYDVVTATDGEDALAKFAATRPHLVLLDVMMPKLNGFRTCERLRALDASVPVIFLTAREGEADEVRGLGLGADDYIAKSASEGVLLARLARALRRLETPDDGHDILPLGPVRIDFATLEVEEDDGARRHLTRTEADLLRLFASDPGRFFSVDETIEALRGRGFACEDTLVYTHIHRLRQKLGPGAERLVCDRRCGYRLLV